jgi:hypothetical protein
MFKRENNPLVRLHNMIATSAKDFSVGTLDLFIYGIILGWDDDSYSEFVMKNRMTIEQAKSNRLDHKEYKKLVNKFKDKME